MKKEILKLWEEYLEWLGGDAKLVCDFYYKDDFASFMHWIKKHKQ